MARTPSPQSAQLCLLFWRCSKVQPLPTHLANGDERVDQRIQVVTVDGAEVAKAKLLEQTGRADDTQIEHCVHVVCLMLTDLDGNHPL